jgi:hypothetical protein
VYELYSDYVLKNPFYESEQARARERERESALGSRRRGAPRCPPAPHGRRRRRAERGAQTLPAKLHARTLRRGHTQVIKCELFDEKVDAMVRRFPAA